MKESICNSKNDTKIEIKIKSKKINNEKNIEEEQLLIDKKNTLSLNSNNKRNKKTKKYIARKLEPKIICCSKRRAKCPLNIESLLGFTMSFFYLTFFTALITYCLRQTKIVYSISDNLINIYNTLIKIIWATFFITIILLIDVFTSDPGVQRGFPISKAKFEESNIKKVVGGKKYVLKYCETCQLIRDIRTFHCKICGICVEKHDHHCFRVSNCIGVYNYKKFYLFLNATLVYLMLIFGICLHYLNYYKGKKTDNIIIFILMIFITIFDLIFLLINFSICMEHIDVITFNITIRESIKKKRYKVYDRGLEENCDEALCRDYIREM